ncbi:MAG TPA: hypothetical protein PK299_13810 [Anaerolineales bacterium]|nr:hypothetical protein [Anaerolineales bacterium]
MNLLSLYLRIVRRWWWLILLPAVVVGLMGWLTYTPPGVSYTAGMRFTAGKSPQSKGQFFDPNLTAWQDSEYLTAGLSDWSKTGDFAERISAELASKGVELPPAAIVGSISSDYTRSQLVLYVNGGSAETVGQVANAAVMVMETQSAAVFPQYSEPPTVIALDTPQVNPVAVGVRSQLELLVRLGLGLAIGIALAFLAHYFDPFVRQPQDLLDLGLPVSGKIPKKG